MLSLRAQRTAEDSTSAAVFFGRVIGDISSHLFRKPFLSLVIYATLLSTAPVEREVSRVTLGLVACAVTSGLRDSAVVFRLCGIVRGLEASAF